MRLAMTAALAMALAAAPAPGAQDPEDAETVERAEDEMKAMSRGEISDKLDADYADLDADNDGKVTADEINARLLKSAEAELEAIRKKRDEAFAKYDTDGDGAISKAEFDARAKLPAVKEPDAKPFLARFDKDKDGTISKEEFRAPTLANFDKLDSDKDGALSVAEREGKAKAAPVNAETPPAKKAPPVKKTPPMGR